MSNEQSTETPAETGPEIDVEPPTAAPEGEQPAEDGQDGDGPLARQAAKFRKRARELETELAAANEIITGLRRQQAEALAEGVRPAALWAVTDLENLLTDGQVDPGKVRAAVQQAQEDLGVQPKRALDIPQEGRAVPSPGSAGRAKWDAAFKPNYQR